MRISCLIPAILLIWTAAYAEASVFTGVVARDGMVLAADSRLNRISSAGDHQVLGDGEVKLISVQDRFLVALGGVNRAQGRPAWRRILDAAGKLPADVEYDAFVAAIIEELSPYYDASKDGERALTMFVAGYRKGTGVLTEVLVPCGKTTALHTTDAPGMAWAGDGGAVLDRLILGLDRRILDEPGNDETRKHALRKYEFAFALDSAALPDAVELAIESIRTCVLWNRLIKGTRDEPENFFPTAGGPVDAAVITESGVRWIQRKDTYNNDLDQPRP